MSELNTFDGPAVGIDLGTTHSCVAVCRRGKVEVVFNDQGNRTTPSYVAFSDHERLAGDAAKKQAARNPSNTVFDVKRLIGRKFTDPAIVDDLKRWPFEVVEEDEKIKIAVKERGVRALFSAEQISSMVLAKLKENAESFLGQTVKNAVVTVPAYFNDAQREATVNAGKICGLNVCQIINEPTAAAIAFGLETLTEYSRKVLAYDFGGGTLDVTIITIQDKKFTVEATAGQSHLGGIDLDNILLNHLCEEFQRKFKCSLKENKRAIRRLLVECENAKKTLSFETRTEICLDSLHNDNDFFTDITRVKFEDLCFDIFRKTLDSVEQCLSDANLTKSDIDEIILVGGSTRIPKVQEILQRFFNGKVLNKTLQPDEAVAQGASLQAAKLSGNLSTDIQDFNFTDVIPLSLGISVVGDRMSTIVGRNSRIPTERTEGYVTTSDNQTSMRIRVFQGERTFVNDNHLLALYHIKGIPRAPAGKMEIDTTFRVDLNGILTVTTKIKSTGQIDIKTIRNCNDRLTNADIEKMIKDAEKYKEYDQSRLKTYNRSDSNWFSRLLWR